MIIDISTILQMLYGDFRHAKRITLTALINSLTMTAIYRKVRDRSASESIGPALPVDHLELLKNL